MKRSQRKKIYKRREKSIQIRKNSENQLDDRGDCVLRKAECENDQE